MALRFDRFFVLALIGIILLTGCAGVGLPIIGSSFTKSENQVGIPDYLIVNNFEIYRGGQPNPNGFKYLKEKNINTIIKLNSEQLGSEKTTTNQLGIKLVLTIIDSSDLYYAINNSVYSQINFAMKALMNRKNWPIYVHCQNGWDRTGLIIALFRVCHDRYSKEDAYNEMVMNGFGTFHRLFLPGIQEYWDKFEISNCEKWRHE
ncbi:fused DSP-PTPase phosphatase/NAD kinase-like protein [Methylomonas rhizoryzae]|uniref:fused DSP-PTPase phosphatase/NAD kinase-like protein n=1 Tax=Methylomonas rhizoryzae TaxID=2608981 RepID=UPI0012320AD6|nr:tyrosine-protein phosphatase [Methylomonas rhizoryzae]